MAANKIISLNDVNQTIDFTFAASDQQRGAALGTLQRVLCAELVPLAREQVRLADKLGAAHPRVVMIAERIEINQAFTREVAQEKDRAQIVVALVNVNTWVLQGFVRDDAGKGLLNLTIALYDSIKPDAHWVKGLGYVCTDANGYFKIEASNPGDYSATPVFVRVLDTAGATLYKDDAPLTLHAGQLAYREFVISGKTLDCPPPPPPPPPGVDLSITKADSPDPVTPNADLTYTLTVTNRSHAEAKDLRVTDTLPAQTTFSSASGSGFTCTHTNGVVNCTLPSLAAGATATITIVVKVSPDVMHGTVLSNTATVTAATSDTDTTNNTAVTTTTVVSAADLSITKADTPDPVVAGQNLTYTLQMTNPPGASAAQNVTVTDAVPANTTFVSAMVTSGTGWTPVTPAVGGTGNVVFSKPSVAAGESATFRIVVKVNTDISNNGDFPTTAISNTATVRSSTTDPSAANNTATATTTVVSAADLSITKTDTPDPVVAGQNLTYTLQMTNPPGASAAQNVTVTDAVPANTTFVSATVTSGGTGWTPTKPAVGGTGNVVFSKASLAPGETASFQIVVKVNTDTTATTISNTATVVSATTDPNAGNNTATATTKVVSAADLSITKTVLDVIESVVGVTPNPVVAGQNVTYMLQVTNPPGASDAQNVTVTDPVPANTTFVSATVTSGGTGWTPTKPPVGGTGNVVFSKASLAPGETASFQIVVKVNTDTTATTISNTATVVSATTDSNTGNNTATATTKVVSAADLSIIKTVLDAIGSVLGVTPNPVVAGQNVTYMLQVTNPPGASAALNVTVTDPVPANTTFVSAAVTNGTGWTAIKPPVGGTGNVVFSKASLVPGETASFQIVVKVNKDTTATTISNTATVTSPTTDPNAANNTATVTTSVIPSGADLSITKTDTPDPVVAGQNVTYTLQVTNPVGALAAQNVTVTDPVPANTTFLSAAVTSGTGWTAATPVAGGSGNVVFSKASVAAGEGATFQIVVKVNTNTEATSISNTATVTSPTIDPNAANNTATVTTKVIAASADLSITKTDDPHKVAAGGNITYTLTITNAGPNVAENVTVTDTIPANTALIPEQVTSPKGWTATIPSGGGPGNVVFSKPSVAPGDTATFQIVVKVNKDTTATNVTNTATVASLTADSDLSNNTVTSMTKVKQLSQTRTALIVFTRVAFTAANPAGFHVPLEGSTRPIVTFTDNVPNSGDLEAAFNSPQSGFAMNQFKGITMADVVAPLDADIKVRLNAVVSALQKASGSATPVPRTSTVVLSASDQTTLDDLSISVAGIDEVIFLEL